MRSLLDGAGRLASDAIAVETLVVDLAESVAAAIRRADSAAAFAPPSSRLRREHGMVRLHFAATRIPSGATLLRVIVPAPRADKAPRVEGFGPLSYPEGLRRAGIAGRVVLQVVVGADGRPGQRTPSVGQAEDRAGGAVARMGVQSMHFEPGRIEQCDVPVLVRLPVDFNIRY